MTSTMETRLQKRRRKKNRNWPKYCVRMFGMLDDRNGRSDMLPVGSIV